MSQHFLRKSRIFLRGLSAAILFFNSAQDGSFAAVLGDSWRHLSPTLRSLCWIKNTTLSRGLCSVLFYLPSWKWFCGTKISVTNRTRPFQGISAVKGIVERHYHFFLNHYKNRSVLSVGVWYFSRFLNFKICLKLSPSSVIGQSYTMFNPHWMQDKIRQILNDKGNFLWVIQDKNNRSRIPKSKNFWISK